MIIESRENFLFAELTEARKQSNNIYDAILTISNNADAISILVDAYAESKLREYETLNELNLTDTEATKQILRVV